MTVFYGYITMLKKILVSIMSLLIAIPLVSCGNLNDSASYNEGEECTITLSWWGGDERHEATKRAVELFESRHPEIHVETDCGNWDGWKTKVFSEYDNGRCADVIQVNYDWLVNLSYNGDGFYDLEKLDKYINLSYFSEDVLRFGRRNGILNAIPFSITGRTVFLNKEAYDSVGVPAPRTWEDLFYAAPKFNQTGIYPLEADNGSGTTAFYIAVVYEQQKTGHQFITDNGEIGFDVDELADALSFYKKLQDNGVVRSVTQMENDPSSKTLYESDTWINGRVAGILEWGSSVAKYQKAFGDPKTLISGNLITIPDAKSTGWMYKPSLLFAISKDTEYPVQSAMLLDFLYNDPDCANILGTTRGIPVSSAALAVLENNVGLSGLTYDSYNSLMNSDPILISPYFENAEMQKYYRDAIEAVSLEILTPEEAAQGIYANIIYTLGNIREGK